MESGIVQALFGSGRGKSACAIGLAIRAANKEKEIVVIQFMKGRAEVSEIGRRLEPEIRVFSFEKSELPFDELSEKEKEEAAINMQNGLGFARKVLSTRDCDVLILDEVFALIDLGIISVSELAKVLEAKADDVSVILTGIKFPEELKPYVDKVSCIEDVEL